MIEKVLKKADVLEEKYDRFAILLFAIIVWTYAIYLTMNLGPNFFELFWGVHMVALVGWYVIACGYTCIFIFWKWFNKYRICSKQ